MRLLWVKAGKLLPVDTGGKIRSYNILKGLAASHEVTLLTYHDGARDPGYERDAADAFAGAITVHVPGRAESFAARVLQYARRVADPMPFAVSKHTAPVVERAVRAAVRERAIDVVVCDFLAASGNVPADVGAPAVLFQHNVESALWARQARYERHPVRRAVFALEARKMDRYERETVRRFGHVVAVSDEDRRLMSAMTDPSRITVVPTGVDLTSYTPPAPGARVESPVEVLFLGSMDWEANIDGVTWFVEEVWPRVRSALPGARFRVVGRKPGPRVQRLAAEDVEIVGGVPAVQPYLHRATLVVVPLRIGGGTRLKIYEAMASACAVVSTRVGAEGLDVTHGRDILLEDEAPAFADAVIALARDAARRQAIEREARATAARYDWGAIAGTFAEVLEGVRDTRTAGVA